MVRTKTTKIMAALLVVWMLLSMTACGQNRTEPTQPETEKTYDRVQIPAQKEEPVREEAPPETEEEPAVQTEPEPQGERYILNTNSKKFHDPACGSVGQMKEYNKEYFTGDRETVIARGYMPCKKCKP